MDIPRIFNITESAHRIHNPITPEKLATLGAALRLESGALVLDLGSGSGEMLGFERTQALFREAAPGPAAGVVEHLPEAGAKWAGGRPPYDDVTFVVVKAK